jgi:tetratricopeptide (TPR) repeat protein
MSARARGLAIGLATAAAVAVVALGALAVAPERQMAGVSSETALVVPADDAAVVAVLQPASTPRSPELLEALRRARSAPDDPDAAREAARVLIRDGRAAGDSRLVGAALGVLRPVMEPPDPETLHLAATARQYQHDFTGALGLLDRAIELDPRHVNARLTRATLKIVQGRIGDALADCARLSELRQDVGFLCQSTALVVTPQAPVVARRLGQIVARPGLLDPSLEGWAIGLLGEIAVNRGDDAEGRDRLEQVIARDPGALRERLLLADLLLRTGDAAAVAPLLAEAPATDGVLLRRALAARALGAPDGEAEAALAQRVRLNLDLGLDAHAREDAMWFLRLADDPARALDRALANWALQREAEDAQLLIDAAMAAGQPEAAAPVLAWMDQEGIEVPALRIPDAVRGAAE